MLFDVPGRREAAVCHVSKVSQASIAAREVLLPPTTNGILEAVASQQIHTIGHYDDFTMHQWGNHVRLRKGALPKTQQQTF